MTAPAVVSNPLSSATHQSVANSVIDDIMAGRPDPDAPSGPDDVPNTVGIGSGDTFSETKESPRGPDGKFVPKVDPNASVKAPAPEETDGTPPITKGEPVAEAEGEEPVVEAPKEPVKLATEFSVVGPDGDELDPGDVVTKVGNVKFTVGGKEYDMPIDRVVRLAKSGVHNEKMYADAQSAIESRDALEQEVTTHKQKIERDTAIYSNVLNDLLQVEGLMQALAPNGPAAQLLTRWQHYNTPEARAERAERALMEERQQKSGQSAQAQSASFVQNDVLQPIQALLQQFPSVTQDEIIGRFTVLTQKYGATIQPRDFAAVRSIVRDTLPAYAASLHETRSKNETALRAARENATLSKKQAAQYAKPIGRRATAAELQAKRPEPRNVKELTQRVIDDALAGL